MSSFTKESEEYPSRVAIQKHKVGADFRRVFGFRFFDNPNLCPENPHFGVVNLVI